MLGINCLLKNLEILPNLRDVVEDIGYSLAADGKSPSIKSVFRLLRAAGVEVDIQTLSNIYEDTFDLSDPIFSSQEEIDEARDQAFNDLLEAEAEEIKYLQIGKDKPSVAVADKFIKALKIIEERIPSVQRLMQDRLAKAAKRATGLKSEKADKKTSEQILREVLQIEKPNDFSGLGRMENAETLWQEFKKEFIAMAKELEGKDDVYSAQKLLEYAEVLEDATYKFFMSAPEVQQVIGDTLKESGFSKTINTKSGSRSVVDWAKLISAGGFDFTKAVKDVFGKKGFSESDTDRIANQLLSDYNAMRAAKIKVALDTKNKDTKRQTPKSAINRLNTLYNLGIFNNANKNALFKLLGVSNVTQARINRLNNLMKIYNQSVQHPVTKWTTSYIRTIQREIENIIEQSEESREGLVKLVRQWGFFSQWNNSFLLSNPQNIAENTTSGIMQFLMTSLTSPKAAFEAAKVVGNVWSDVAQGGVREGHELYNTFNSSGNLEDRYNVETAKTTGDKIKAYAALLPRVALSAMDNSIKAGLVHEMGVGTLKKVLMRQGLTASEANTIINDGFYGNKAEIEAVAKQLENNLVAMGVNTARGKWKRLASEMAWANMLTDGQFFHETLDKLKQQGQVRQSVNPTINEPLLKAIRGAAETAASKGLGHQGDSMIVQFMDAFSQYFSGKVTEARQRGSGLAWAEIQRNVFANVNRYRPGSLRWWWLSFEKSSGLALLQTLITDVLLGKRILGGNYFSFKTLDVSDTNDNLEEDLAKYLSLRQRLVRETVGPVFAYTVGNIVLSSVLSSFGGADDKERVFEFAKWMYEDDARKRWLQKLLPPQTYNYLTSIAWRDQFGNVKTKKIEDIKDPKDLRNLIDAENVLRNFANNFSEANVNRLFRGLQKSLGQGDTGGVEVGQFIGNFLNLGGALRSGQIWKDAFTSDPRMSKEEWKQIKPETGWEGFLQQTLNEDLYERTQLNSSSNE